MANEYDVEKLIDMANNKTSSLIRSSTTSFSIGSIPTQIDAHFAICLQILNTNQIIREEKLKFTKCIILFDSFNNCLKILNEAENCLFSANTVFFF